MILHNSLDLKMNVHYTYIWSLYCKNFLLKGLRLAPQAFCCHVVLREGLMTAIVTFAEDESRKKLFYLQMPIGDMCFTRCKQYILPLFLWETKLNVLADD